MEIALAPATAPVGGRPRAADYAPAAWVLVLRRVAMPLSVALIGGSILCLAVTGHVNLALLGLPGTVIAVSLMHRLPRHLPPINYLRSRDLGVVERETEWTLVVALLHPIAIVPVVLLAKADPIPLLGRYSSAPLLSLDYVIFAKVLLLAVPAIILAGRFGRPLRQLGLRSVDGHWRWLGPIVPIALLCAGLLVLTGAHIERLPPAVLVAILGVAVVHAGFPEEAFYRCLLQTRLELLLGSPAGIATTSVLFGLRHVPSIYAFVWRGTTSRPLTDLLLSVAAVLAYQAVFGVLFGYMWMRYRNAWMNMLGHTLFDAFAFLGLVVSA